MKKSFEPIKYKKMYESLLLAFLEKCLPESGRSLDIDGQHSFYMDIDNSFKGFWCMFDHDKIIGTVAVKELNDKSCELKSLYLLKQYHGKGYGKCLLQKAIVYAKEYGYENITCTASEVLRAGHGICFAKSHLLAALLRYKSIPTGFCYQKLILDDETAPVLIYHGLNGVYIKEYKKWIRLDARGNKERVNAQFSIDKEQLAFPVRLEKGEKDCFTVYPNPDLKVLEKLRTNKTRTELWNDLPTELEYDL